MHGKLAQQAHQAGDRIKPFLGVEEPLNNLVGIAVRCLPQVSGGEGGERRSDWDCSYEWLDNLRWGYDEGHAIVVGTNSHPLMLLQLNRNMV